MAALNPYLNFNGNTKEAFDFYKSVFGGDFVTVMKFKEAPAEFQTNPSEADRLMHIALPIGKNTILMGSDTSEQYGKAITGTNVHISITADSKEEADKLFNGLAAGGKITMPISNTFWGAYFGMLIDKYDIRWMVNFDPNRQNQ